MTTAHTECNTEGCHRNPHAHDVLYRVAPKGQIGPWACAEHAVAERAAWGGWDATTIRRL